MNQRNRLNFSVLFKGLNVLFLISIVWFVFRFFKPGLLVVWVQIWFKNIIYFDVYVGWSGLFFTFTILAQCISIFPHRRVSTTIIWLNYLGLLKLNMLIIILYCNVLEYRLLFFKNILLRWLIYCLGVKRIHFWYLIIGIDSFASLRIIFVAP